MKDTTQWFSGKWENLLLRHRGDNINTTTTTIYICYLPAGRSVEGKTVPAVLSTARGRRPRAVLKTKGTVFPYTDRPRQVNNIFIFFPNICEFADQS